MFFDKLAGRKSPPDKVERYWSKKRGEEVIAEADELYEQERYVEVYEMLNRMKFNGNPEVQWRICRVLFNMSMDESYRKGVRKEMIEEGYELMKLAVSLG